jgi:vacuolar-type H+-ATPase subunit F/Vma7
VICWNEILILGNQDFIYELNILGTTDIDETKQKYSMILTCVSAFADKSQDVAEFTLT